MKNVSKFSFLFLTLIILISCSKNTEEGQDKINVITTFTLLENIVSEIGGEYVSVFNLVPTGTDPHEYDPLPEDMAKTEEADLLFYNGLQLEGDEETGWFAKLVEATNQDWEHIYKVSEGIEPMYLSVDDGTERAVNPHSFLDPMNGIMMTKNIRDALIEIDPDQKAVYEENAKEYMAKLEEIHKQYEEKIAAIPEDNRILVTSERAFQYVADRYGLKEGFIWEVDTEENGTPEQITSLITFIQEHEPPVLFVETNVDKRPMETVATETGVEIYGEIFSDEIGKKGELGDTYIKFLQHNIDLIYDGLTSKQ